MDPMQQISLYYANLSKSEKMSCDLIMKNPEVIIDNPIAQAAKIFRVSPSSILRLAKRIGYKGYSEFRYELEKYQNKQKPNVVSSNFSKVLSAYQTLIKQLNQLNYEDDLKKLSRLLHDNEIITVGIGDTAFSAKYLAYGFFWHNRQAMCYEETVTINFMSYILNSRHVVLLYTVSGLEDTYEKKVKEWKKTGASIVLITCNPNVSYKNYCNFVFILPNLPIEMTTQENEIHYLNNRNVFNIFNDIIMSYYFNEK